MSTENKPVLKDLSFIELIAIRDHLNEIHSGWDNTSPSDIDRELRAEVEYLDTYIFGKYKYIKANSVKSKS